MAVEILIADNSENNIQEIEIPSKKNFKVSVYPYHKNLGYLGAVSRLIEDKGIEKVKEQDFVIISNVDLILSETFFTELLNRNLGKKTGWIAPQIFSLSRKEIETPKS